MHSNGLHTHTRMPLRISMTKFVFWETKNRKQNLASLLRNYLNSSTGSVRLQAWSLGICVLAYCVKKYTIWFSQSRLHAPKPGRAAYLHLRPTFCLKKIFLKTEVFRMTAKCVHQIHPDLHKTLWFSELAFSGSRVCGCLPPTLTPPNRTKTRLYCRSG